MIDPAANKYYSLSPYVYVANSPLIFIDPDGKKIVYVVRGEGGSYTKLTYSKGNFLYQNGSVYNPKNGLIGKGLDITLESYRIIETSGDKVLMHKLHTLKKSKKYHFIEEVPGGGNAVSAYEFYIDASMYDKIAENGIPLGTKTIQDFSKETKEYFEKIEGIKDSDFGTVCHEMQHQYDYDQGENKDDQDNTEKDPSEIRAVNNENRGRSILGFLKRLTYGGKKIDPKKWKSMNKYITLLYVLLIIHQSSCKNHQNVCISEKFIHSIAEEPTDIPSQFSNVFFFCKCEDNEILSLNIFELNEIYKKNYSEITYHIFLSNVLNQKCIVNVGDNFKKFRINKNVEKHHIEMDIDQFVNFYCEKRTNKTLRLKSDIKSEEISSVLYFLFLNNYIARIDDHVGEYIIICIE